MFHPAVPACCSVSIPSFLTPVRSPVSAAVQDTSIVAVPLFEQKELTGQTDVDLCGMHRNG